MYRLICQKPAHFLSAQMALVSTFFQMFIVLGMYNFGLPIPKMENFGYFSAMTDAKPSSIYSCSIGHILEHEFCHLGCWAVLWKISETTKILLKYATFWGVFFYVFMAKKLKI